METETGKSQEAIDDFINRKVQDSYWYWYSLLRCMQTKGMINERIESKAYLGRTLTTFSPIFYVKFM